MAEELEINLSTDKAEQYRSLIPQIEALIANERNFIANLANISAALKAQFDWLWAGFYLVEDNELVLGPFQGPVACTRIGYGKGVCGTAWKEAKTLLVDDVEAFPGHIACSSLAKSEIVVPLFNKGKVAGVFDADSVLISGFNHTDRFFLEKLLAKIILAD